VLVFTACSNPMAPSENGPVRLRGDITRSTDASPEMFLRYKHALMAHMSDFMAELDRYLPRLAHAALPKAESPTLAAVRTSTRPLTC